MLNKIIYTILGFGLAFLVLPKPSHDATRQPLISGIATTAEVPASFTAPELASSLEAPELSAKSALAYDFGTGSVLYSKNMDERLPIASLTKLMTALVVLDHAKLDDVVTIDKYDQTAIGSTLGLALDEKITVESLLKGMLIPSANDAALALANHIAQDLDTFAVKMNEKAQALGLPQTHFANPVGWDSDDNYSSALDLVRIVQEFAKHEKLMEIVGTRHASVFSTDKRYEHQLVTTNRLLLENPDVIGIKTGFTSKALGNLIIMNDHNDRKILTLILGSTDREADTQKLTSWLFNVYRW